MSCSHWNGPTAVWCQFSHAGTGQEQWLCVRSGSTRSPQSCWSGSCLSRGWSVRLHRTSRLTWGSSPALCWLSRRQLRPTWLACLRTPTWQPSMPREWPSCPRTSSLLAVSEARELKFSPQQTTPGDLNHHHLLFSPTSSLRLPWKFEDAGRVMLAYSRLIFAQSSFLTYFHCPLLIQSAHLPDACHVSNTDLLHLCQIVLYSCSSFWLFTACTPCSLLYPISGLLWAPFRENPKPMIFSLQHYHNAYKNSAHDCQHM